MESSHSKEFIVPMMWGGPDEGMETKEQLLGRVRRRLAASGTRGGKTWEELFVISDKNRDGHLNFQEFMNFVRKELKIPQQTVCDYELKILFNEIDKNGAFSVDSAELVEYMQHGARRPQDDAARYDDRINRVKRNMRIAFQAIGGSDLDPRKIFSAIDSDGNARLSQYEFFTFVRGDLGLTRWDVQNSALADFYHHIDPNGEGIELQELLNFLRQMQRDKHLTGPQALYIPPKDVPKLDKRRKTHKQRLIESLPRSGPRRQSSLPFLFTHTFANLGRESPVRVK